MTIIKRSALVSYTQRQMFELVNNIEDYPRFLPWCHNSHIVSRDAEHVEATLDIAWSGMHKSFTTRDHLYPYERIDITLVTGPFKHLEGRWMFQALGEEGCKVNMELEFELTGNVFDRVFQPIFSHITNSLVDAFCKRAIEVYGAR
jgi:ribosome-associated toxin RatA of RatAB toxin-antitoxin module